MMEPSNPSARSNRRSTQVDLFDPRRAEQRRSLATNPAGVTYVGEQYSGEIPAFMPNPAPANPYAPPGLQRPGTAAHPSAQSLGYGHPQAHPTGQPTPTARSTTAQSLGQTVSHRSIDPLTVPAGAVASSGFPGVVFSGTATGVMPNGPVPGRNPATAGPDRSRLSQPKATATGRSASRVGTRGVRSPDVRYLLAGSSILAGLVLMGDVTQVFKADAPPDVCQEMVQAESVLSRNSLSQLLAVPERQPKAAIRDIVSEPYCTMPSVEVRAGVVATREAYPLAFDPQTWLILLYEGEEYAGYAFSFRP